MSETSAVRPHLVRRFETQRVVFWHDPEGEYAADLDALDLEGVRTVRVTNDEYAVKNRLLHQEPKAKFLVYRSGAVPTDIGNWLLDLELAYGVFTADRTSLVQQELGLTADGIGEAVQAGESFFRVAKRVQSLKKLLVADDDTRLLQAKMSAVLLGQSEHSLLEITRTLLIENASGADAKYSALAEHGLDDFYWQGAASIYGYTSPSPSIGDLVLWVFRQANAGFKSERPGGLRNIQLDFGSFRNDRRSEEALTTLAKRAARDLDYASTIEDASFRDLLGNDLFEDADRKIISDLARAVAERTVTPREVTEVIRSRQSSIWVDGYRKLYAAIGCASELLTTLSTLNLTMQSFDEGLERYRGEWFRIDQLYRQFTYAARTAEFSGPLEELRAQVEKFYANKFLYDLGNAWQQQVDGINEWRSVVLRPQTSFYTDHVAPITKDGRRKAVVIISDAMRYEIADELGSRIRQEDRYDADLKAMLGVLPSYTQLGMAALLPHSTIGHGKDGDPVLADGQRTDRTVNRSKILDTVDGKAIQAEDVFSLTRDELRELYQQHQVLYVYHDRIDATGDKAGTERQVFEAAEDTLRELVDLVKRLTNANATNILITADHGFLFQDSALAEAFYLSTLPQGDDIKVTNRRYVLGRGLKEDPAFRTFTPAQLGLNSDLDVQIPKSIHRLRLPGAGSRFVHGGAALQEVVIPVLAINKKRKSDVRTVNVKIMPESDKITTGQLVIKLFQTDPASEKVHPLVLRAGLYVGETLISNHLSLTFDQESTDQRDRYQNAHMLLSQDANDYNNRAVEFRLEELIPGTNQWRVYAKAIYTLKRSFGSDFDFKESAAMSEVSLETSARANAAATPVQSELDRKINQFFPGAVVRKDLVKTVKGNAIVPSYVLEYLLGQYAASDDEDTIQAGIASVRKILSDHYVNRNQSELVKSTIKERGRHRIIDKVTATLNEKDDVYQAEFANLGIKGVIVEPATIKAHPKLLVGGVWCICDIEYVHSNDARAVPWILGSIKPIQLSNFDFEGYLAARREFTTDEWADLLVQSIGFNPELFGRRAKLIQLVRLIPFVERNYNLVELGPKGTGKSHIFSEFSPHGMLISGGEVTVPKLFVNNSNGRIGLVGYWDVVAFDEFAGKKKRSDKALVDIMKNYMANKSFSRGIETLGAEASMVFVGNTSHTVPYMLKHSDLFDELPESYHDSAYLDRLHHYIPGWEVDTIRGEMFSNGYGFVVDYIAEVLKSMRSADYSDRYQRHFTLSSDISTRDRDGIHKTFSGLMKILYPHGEATQEEIEEILTFAIEGRKRVKDQILRIDSTMADVKFGYLDKTGTWHSVSTLEEEEYPGYYYRERRGGGEAEDAADDPTAGSSAAAVEGPQPTSPEPVTEKPLFEGHREFQENQRGVSFDTLLVPYLRGATKITITDPYIRQFHQARNLMELIERIAASKDAAEEVSVKLITSENTEGEDKLRKQFELLLKIKQGASVGGINVDVVFDGGIHDRSILTDTGWRILLGRGLDIFQYVAGDAFDLATKLQDYRQVKAFGVTYIRESE